MFCLAAQRKIDGKLVAVSPEHGFEFDVDENTSVELGQFCCIEIENNVPKKITKEETRMEGLTVFVKKDLALVSGVVGKLVKTFAYFYETNEFGKVACRDKHPEEAGTEHKIIVSRLPEEGRTGMYSKCVWGAVSDVLVCGKEDDDEVQDLNIEFTGAQRTSRNISSECDVEPKEGTSNNRAPDETLLKTVSGFIIKLDRSKSHALMTCSLSFPRTDISIRLSVKNPLKIGDFVEVYVTPDQYEKHFPSKPTKETPKLITKSYRKVETPLGYIIHPLKTAAQLTIRNVKLPSDYKKKGNIYDPYIGVISDKIGRIPGGSSSVDITISRHNVFAGKGGEMTSWLVTEANDVRESFEKKSCGMKNKSLEKPGRLQSLSETKTKEMNSHADEVRNDKFNKKVINERELVTKVAVVTSVKPNPKFKGTIAYLWLLDDVKKSIFYLTREQKLEVGHFFQGGFVQNGDEWECKKYNNAVPSYFEKLVRDDSIEFKIRVHEYFPETTERMLPETCNQFLGKIVDRYRKLPENCSGGVNISVRQYKNEAKNEWCWMVTQVFGSKYVQLLTEFNNAWNAPGISDIILKKFPTRYYVWNKVFGVRIVNRLNSICSGTSNVDRNVVKGREEEDENKNYAWIMENGEDSVRMIVFPRREGKTINTLKVDVTKISKRSAGITAGRLYEVRLNEKTETIELNDCPQYFSADENRHFVFEFTSTANDRIAKNIAIVEPVGMPKWLGKLMFLLPGQSITKRKTLWRGRFKLLDNKNPFIDCEEASADGVCFINVGEVEKLITPEFSKDTENQSKNFERSGSDDQDHFRKKLGNLSRDDIFRLYKLVGHLLRDEQLVEELKKRNVYTQGMQIFQNN